MKEVEAVILAGGAGLRLGELTKNRQKCLLPIDGRPLLGHIIENLVVAFGSVDIKIAVGYKEEQVKEYVEVNKPKKVSVTYVPHVLGVEGWGIYKDLKSHIKGLFVATPGDIVASPDIYTRAIELFESSRAEAAINLANDRDRADTHGVGKIDQEQVIELQWPPPDKLDDNHLRDMTIWASDPRIFRMIEKYPSPKKSIGYVFMKAIKDGVAIAGNNYKAQWIHLGYVKDLQEHLLVTA